MSKQGVKHVIAALISDPIFNKAFFTNKKKTLRGCGFSLTKNEIKALLCLKKTDVIVKLKLTKPYDIIVPVKIKGPPPNGIIR
ncbi:MAG: hypothetical protein JSV98_09505 [candidate division WOR-3 bacterium]|nr:MAG: hypothetical protein JSV98_09505 [candidate division WOR-3 bacterium]